MSADRATASARKSLPRLQLLTGLQGMGLLDLASQTVRNFVAHDLGTYAAALAFSSLLALFPFAIFVLGLVGAAGRPEFFDWLLQQAGMVLPGDAFGSMRQVVSEVRSQQGNLISLGIGLALWAASTGMRSLMTGLNAAYEVPETRPVWVVYPLSLLYTIGLAALLSAAAGLMLIGPRTAAWLARNARLEHLVGGWDWVRWPVIVLLLFIVVATIYYVAPNVRQPFVLVTPGSVLTVTFWAAASAAFSFYVGAFGNYGATYGSLAGVIVLMLYCFLSSAVLLLGAALNAVIFRFVERRDLADVEKAPPA